MLSSVHKTKPKSYAQAAKSATPSAKKSLLHTDITPSQQPNEQYARTLRTRLYRAARTNEVYLFDITECKGKYTDQQCMMVLKDQHPNVHACLPLSDGPSRYLEVYIKPESDTNNIKSSGCIFEDIQLQVLPCKAIDDQAKIVKLKLSHLPMFTLDEVITGLKQSLAMFSDILDAGIFTEKATGLFMGTGYAVLNIYQAPDTPIGTKFANLGHQLSWCESSTEVFHATWNNMPTWCRYCHKDGHSKYDCPSSKARILCYACHEQGHRSYECPRRNASTPPNKRQDRKSYQNKEDAPMTPEKTKEQMITTDSQQEEDSDIDAMSMIEDNTSNADVDEEVFQGNIQLAQQDLDEYSPEQVETVINAAFEAQEIAPIKEEADSQGVIGWSIVKSTVRSEAVIAWLQKNKFAHLHQSTSIANRRPSQVPFGEYIPQQVKDQLNI
jgi:hypothetical protein